MAGIEDNLVLAGGVQGVQRSRVLRWTTTADLISSTTLRLPSVQPNPSLGCHTTPGPRFHTKYICFHIYIYIYIYIYISIGVGFTSLSVMRSNNNNNNNNKTEKKHGRPAVDAEGLDLVKAAAWAWYERAHRSTAVKECNLRFFTKKPSHSVYKPSRFRAEASADRKRGGSTEYVDQYNNKAKRHSLDNSRLSRGACTDFAADGRSSRDEAEYLKRSVCNLDDKCSERWDFGKSLLDSYEIVAIFKYVDNYAPFNASLRLGSESRADQEAAPAADTNGNIIANTDGAVADLCLLASEDGRSMCSPTSEMAGVLEIGTAQKQRYLHSIFSLNAFSKRLKSLAHLQFVRLHHRDRRPHQHRHDHRHPCRVQDLNR